MNEARIVHLVSEDVSVIIVQDDDSLPVILHWGVRLPVEDETLRAFAAAEERPGLEDVSDLPYRASVLPEHSAGWFGRPGVEVQRDGAAWSPRFSIRAVALDGAEMAAGELRTHTGAVTFFAHDAFTEIELELEIDLQSSGLLRTRTRIRNASSSPAPLEVGSVLVSLPIPVRANEALDFTGRWAHERIPQRHPIVHGLHVRESRRGRTGLDATMLVAAGTPGFGSDDGEVWVGHVGFSGNHEHALERTDSALAFRGGELLLPGEVRLRSGEEYVTPWVFGSYGVGLDAASHRFHDFLRARSRSSRRPRPVTLNVWEAVYFDHDEATISALATEASQLGVERFVLDDGWFRGRRDDRAGLGDWTPDPAAWPGGLRPLAEHVRGLGMEFGLWVEPEMINEDSDLARAHPDWILRARPELPALFRFQQVLDLTNPEAYAHILTTLDDLIRDVGISYLKWDHNRDLIDAGHPGTGRPAVHEQTTAVYRMLDELRRRHPDLEIESCASGGGRVDLGILERTDRIHPSDSHDPIDRFHILRWTGLLVPPEMLGSHVASAVSSVTGRTHSLPYRCAVAFLGHFGIEWDIRSLAADEREQLAWWVSVHRRFRRLIQDGRPVGGGELDPSGPAMRGIVAADGAAALYTIVTPPVAADTRARVRFSGLDDKRDYRVTVSAPESLGPPWQVPDWIRDAPGIDADDDAGVAFSGAVLRLVGLEFPTFHPERAAIVRLTAAG